jgi:hypothetical protein
MVTLREREETRVSRRGGKIEVRRGSTVVAGKSTGKENPQGIGER